MAGAILITGAARGLGADLARGLAGAGFTIVGVARSSERLAALAADIAESGGRFIPIVGDARDTDALELAIAAAEQQPGGLYGVIANAGIAGPTALLQDISVEDWQTTFDVNVTAVFQLCKLAIPALTAHGNGRIIVIGSVTGKRPLQARTPYAASKLALVGLARTLAVELGPAGVTVNVVSPWLLEGDRLESVITAQADMRASSAADVRAELQAGTATGLTVSADDVLASCEYLLAQRSRNITGQDINVSAGAVMY